MIAFIDDHRNVHGVEPICHLLPIAPSTYHAHRARRVDPSRLPDCAKRDAELRIEIARVHAENLGVYRARKVWRQLLRESHGADRAMDRPARTLHDAGNARTGLQRSHRQPACRAHRLISSARRHPSRQELHHAVGHTLSFTRCPSFRRCQVTWQTPRNGFSRNCSPICRIRVGEVLQICYDDVTCLATIEF
ncbi:integrase, catalytic region [Pseudooceanicola batsensis HTCC2597]|uniref:Integrase, catalytic region n=1 Tax=Pseudooceanicola batsensis (strain ATCC BAA-863 / DSM 15984 / KCTC 12145 / HTCC2597) TaxID=252305 RepID=A3TSJ9_PSEBH|nr:integrase, catalytic region [Pseudooceanicola batsensis HTCC2597]